MQVNAVIDVGKAERCDRRDMNGSRPRFLLHRRSRVNELAGHVHVMIFEACALLYVGRLVRIV